MAEQQRPGEQKKVEQLEILDLKNHIGFYGRILMASQAQEAEVANILNPSLPVEFNFAADKIPLEKRNYNPVFENLSFAERKEEWKTVPSFDEAYSQWRTSFTKFMKDIKKDSSRELALKAILPDRDAATFTEDDADGLFQKFCGGKSDTHKFISQITEHVVNSKINPTNLQTLLSDLEWIAGGLFGRQTAGMATRLVDLESQLRNDHAKVLAAFNSDKERIRTPQPAEKGVLSNLYSLIPQVKGPTQEIGPAPVIPKSDEEKDENKQPPVAPVQPPSAAEQTPSPAPPAAKKEREAVDANKLSSEELNTSYTDTFFIKVKVLQDKQPPFDKFWEPLERVLGKDKAVKSTSVRDNDNRTLAIWLTVDMGKEQVMVSQLADGIPDAKFRLIDDKRLEITPPEAKPAPATVEAQPNIIKIGENEIEEIKVEGDADGLMRLKINGKDTGLQWYKRETGGKFFYIQDPLAMLFGDNENLPEHLELPKGLAAMLYIHHYVTNDSQNRYMGIMGGKDVKIGLKGDFVFNLSIFPKDYFVAKDATLADEWFEKSKGKEGQAIEMDASGNFLSGDWVEAKDVLRHLEKSFKILEGSLSPVSRQAAAKENPTGEKIAPPAPSRDESLESALERAFGTTPMSPAVALKEPAIELGLGAMNLKDELNQELSQSQNESETCSASPDVLKEFIRIASAEKGFQVEGGGIKVGKDNQITISDLRITQYGTGVTLDVVLNNDANGIVAKMTKFHRDLAARLKKESSREEVEKKLKDINSAIKENLDKRISQDNPKWKTRKVSISGDRVLITFNKTA